MMVRVQDLIDSAAFRDAHILRMTKHAMINYYFDNMTEEFIQSVIDHGIQVPVHYDPEYNALYNGHNRVIMAWLLGIEKIETVDPDDNIDDLLANGGPPARCAGFVPCNERQ